MSRHSTIGLVIVTVLVLVSLISIVTSMTGPSWVTNTSGTIGFLQMSCQLKNCSHKRFFDNPLAMEKMLTMWSCGIVFTSLSLITLSITWCCRHQRRTGYCLYICTILFLIVAEGSVFATLIINEYHMTNDFKGYKRGWCNMVLWLGGSLLFFSIITSMIALCIVKKSIPENILQPPQSSSKYAYTKRGGLTMQDIRPRSMAPRKF